MEPPSLLTPTQSRSEAAALRTSLQNVTAELEAERSARLLASSEVHVSERGPGSRNRAFMPGLQTCWCGPWAETELPANMVDKQNSTEDSKCTYKVIS
jgi:hypothetical protein